MTLIRIAGYFLGVQWLGLGAFTSEGLGSIPCRGTKIPQAMRLSQKQNQTKKGIAEDLL